MAACCMLLTVCGAPAACLYGQGHTSVAAGWCSHICAASTELLQLSKLNVHLTCGWCICRHSLSLQKGFSAVCEHKTACSLPVVVCPTAPGIYIFAGAPCVGSTDMTCCCSVKMPFWKALQAQARPYVCCAQRWHGGLPSRSRWASS